MLESYVLNKPQWALQISHEAWRGRIRDIPQNPVVEYEKSHVIERILVKVKNKCVQMKELVHRKKRVYYHELRNI